MYRSAPATIGGYDAAMEFTVPWHRHRALQFNLVIRGHATFLVDDRTHRLRPRSTLWIFPEKDHILLDATADSFMWFGYFPPPILKRWCTTPPSRVLRGKSPPPNLARELSPSAASKLASLFHEIAHETTDPSRRRAAVGYALLTAWEVHCHSDTVTPSVDIPPAVERATRLLYQLAQKEGKPLSLEELGRRCGLSASRLSRLFHAHIGMTIPEFRNRQRIDHFLRLFSGGTQYTLTEAAFAANFQSYSQFQRAFHKVMRMSPAAYRRRTLGTSLCWLRGA